MPQALGVNTARLRGHGSKLDAANAEHTAQLTANAAALSASQTAWAGTTFGAFEQLRDTWELGDAARAKRLDDIAINMLRAADVYDHRDDASGQDIARQM